jgi:hypothetical protein
MRKTIYTIGDKKEYGLQYQFEFDGDEVGIVAIDLEDWQHGFRVDTDRDELMKFLRTILFGESKDNVVGDTLLLASAVKALLAEFCFTTPILDGNDRVAYDAFALRIVEIIEAYKAGNDFNGVLICDEELTEAMNKE